MSDGSTYVIRGLQSKRSEMAGRMVDLRRELNKLQADFVHVNAVLRLYGLVPEEIPTKGGHVQKVGHGRGVRSQPIEGQNALEL